MSEPKPVSAPEPTAAIDVGSNSIRMCVAEISSDGRVNELDYLTRPVRLGVDTFRRGRIGGEAIRAACEALSGFKTVMQTYRVSSYRAVATSAVREAANSDAFLDRVRVVCGLDLEVVEGVEESRLTYRMVRSLLGDRFGFADENSMILSLGAGSAEITVLEKGRVVFSETRRIGTLRLLEVLDVHSEKSTRRLLSVFVNDVAASVVRFHPDLDIRRFYLICSDIRRVVEHLGAEVEKGADLPIRGEHAVYRLPRAKLDAFRKELERLDLNARADKLDLTLDEVETLLPAVVAVQSFWNVTRAGEAVVLDISMLDSLLLDFSSSRRGDGVADDFHEQVLSSAVGLGRRYRFDEPHAMCVRRLALQIFDGTAALHGLGARARLLLGVAAVLHDIGLFIGPNSHHKHSMYLIRNSELMGLNRDDLKLVSLAARYHRRSAPRSQHPEYSSLPPADQMLVTKLAAILRIAEALDRSHAGRVAGVSVELADGEAVFYAHSDDDLSLEEWSLPNKADLFESLYGCTVRLRIRPVEPGRP